jgi:hypothetical protein
MATALEERIGGNLPPAMINQLFEEMRRAPVMAFSKAVEVREKNLVIESMDHTGKESIIEEVVDTWLEVR